MPETEIYQLKITINDIEPPIWRRILVPGGIDLLKLHRVFQAAMGWTNSHLHLFDVEGTRYLDSSAGFDMEPGERNERGVLLSEVAPSENARFRYDYDMGDGWEHDVVVEKIVPVDPSLRYPVCLQGERACPPEDCGGVPGYYELLGVLENPGHPEYEEMLEWLERPYDPERFDITAANRALGKLAISVPGAASKPARATKGKSAAAAATVGGSRFTERQGQYLAFIYYYILLNRLPPAEADIARFFGVSGPSAHLMVVTLEERGLISRIPGQGRSIRLLVPRSELPDLELPAPR